MRKFENTRKARSLGLEAGIHRSVKAFGAAQGVLFLEHVSGVTLLECTRTIQAGKRPLPEAVADLACLLAILHRNASDPALVPDSRQANSDSPGYVRELEKHGVLKEQPQAADEMTALVSIWSGDESLLDYQPALVHGDATTTNFVCLPDGGMVAMGWERMREGDRAFDIGRFFAALSHSLDQALPTTEGMEHLGRAFLDAYISSTPALLGCDTLRARIRLYQAASMLRIARNGWVPIADRLQFVRSVATPLQR
jgi:aminoglycoside phosphotransferase (APT) family kinase protein